MEDFAKTSMLFDIYGELLTDKKKRILEMYYEDDMTLTEISDELGITRSAVHDSLRSSEKHLISYECKLGFMADYLKRERLLADLSAVIDSMEANLQNREDGRSTDMIDRNFGKSLVEIRNIISELD